MYSRIAAATALGALGVLALAPMAQAEEDVDVAAWLKANKDTIEFFLDVDVDTCKGLEGITYDESVRLADAEGIDLKELAKHTDPAEILDYVNEAGVTFADIDRFLTAFCAGEVEVPPPSSTSPGSSEDPSAAPSDTDSSSPPAGAKDDKSDAPKSEDVNGEMANTGSDVNPFVITGIGLGGVAVGSAAYILARKRGML